jgi:hypothetical protein
LLKNWAILLFACWLTLNFHIYPGKRNSPPSLFDGGEINLRDFVCLIFARIARENCCRAFPTRRRCLMAAKFNLNN